MDALLELLTDLNPDVDYETCGDLVDGGWLDSLQIMSLVVSMEDEFHVSIDPAEVVAENFNSAQAIWQLIEKHRK